MAEQPATDLAHARWAPRLSEYLDDELAPADRAACAAHLAQCPDCVATLNDLQQLVRALAGLAAAPQSHATDGDDGWSALAARLPVRRAAWRSPAPWLSAAAAIALVVVGVMIGRREASDVAQSPSPTTATAPAPITRMTGPVPVTATSRAARPTYEASVRELEQLLRAERATLAPETVAVLERSLRTIDTAISEAQRAVATDPANPYLESHLARTRARKLALLRQAVQLGQS